MLTKISAPSNYFWVQVRITQYPNRALGLLRRRPSPLVSWDHGDGLRRWSIMHIALLHDTHSLLSFSYICDCFTVPSVCKSYSFAEDEALPESDQPFIPLDLLRLISLLKRRFITQQHSLKKTNSWWVCASASTSLHNTIATDNSKVAINSSWVNLGCSVKLSHHLKGCTMALPSSS